ncbi:MAG: hypothetical protein HRT47_04450 [Candidatus Caenarcaniphilales bacterium]|nr:hypothetical protein [Candidatus Caenarcaniphilales bacterium]
MVTNFLGLGNLLRKYFNRNQSQNQFDDKSISNFLVKQGLNERLAQSFTEEFIAADTNGDKNGQLDLDEFLSLEHEFKDSRLSLTFTHIKNNWEKIASVEVKQEISQEINDINPSSAISPDSIYLSEKELLAKISNSKSFSQNEKEALKKLLSDYFENIDNYSREDTTKISEQEAMNTLLTFQNIPKKLLNKDHTKLQKQLRNIKIEELDFLDGEKFNTVIYDFKKIRAISMESARHRTGHDFFINEELAKSNNLKYDEVFSISYDVPGLEDKYDRQVSFFKMADSIASQNENQEGLIVNLSYPLTEESFPWDDAPTLEAFNAEYGTNLTSFNPNDISEEDLEKIRKHAINSKPDWLRNEVETIEKLAKNPKVAKINIAAGNKYKPSHENINITGLIVGKDPKINIVGGHFINGEDWSYNYDGYEVTKPIFSSTTRPNVTTPLAGKLLNEIKVSDQELEQIISEAKLIRVQVEKLEEKLNKLNEYKNLNSEKEQKIIKSKIKKLDQEFQKIMGERVLSIEQVYYFLGEVFGSQAESDSLSSHLDDAIEYIKKHKLENGEKLYIQLKSLQQRRYWDNTDDIYFVNESGVLTGKMNGTSNAAPQA